MNIKAIALSFLVLAAGSAAQAECLQADPLCKAMHSMANGLKCLKQQTTFLCAATEAEEITNFQAAATDARAALLARPSSSSEQAQAMINAYFDRLDLTLMRLKTEADPEAKVEILKELDAVKKEAHSEF